MRSFYVTSAAVALFATAAALGQSQSSPSQSSPPQSSPPQQSDSNADANDNPTHTMTAACRKMAADKKLTGDAKTQYIKECAEGKKTREGH
jgi:hypothetical protein